MSVVPYIGIAVCVPILLTLCVMVWQELRKIPRQP